MHPSVQSDLIFDIGFHIGDDSAYYLSRGYRVIAVDANELLVERGRERFKAEVESGQLTILSAAIWHTTGEKIPFYINDTYSGHSSIDRDRPQAGQKYHKVEVLTVTIVDLFKSYGIPWYLKIDIEGADAIAVSSLPHGWPMPMYLSCELDDKNTMISLLSGFGYTNFKLINPGTLTQSLPIFNNEVFLRSLRKLGAYLPPVRSSIAALPEYLRPKKILWDPPRTRFSYQFSIDTTGPFAEETDGDWLSEAEMRRHLDYLFRQYAKDGINNYWYDLHAKHGTATVS